MGGGGANAAGGLLVALCIGACAIVFGLLIGALILLAAVWLANKCLPQPGRRYYDDYDDDDDDDDDWDSVSRSRRRRSRRRSRGTAIPTPSFGWAVLIVFVNFIANFIVNLMIGFVGGVAVARVPAGAIAVWGCEVVVDFLISAGILTPMLPPTFPRACLVTLFQFLIGLAIAIIIFVPLMIAGVGLAGLKR